MPEVRHVFTLAKAEEPPTVLKAADDKVSATPPKPRKGAPPPLSKKSKPERSGDRPRRRTREAGGGSSMMMMLPFFVLGGGGLFRCIACVGVIGWFSLHSGDVKPAGPIAANDKKDKPFDMGDRDLIKNVDAPLDAAKPNDKFDDKKDFPGVDKMDLPPIDGKKDLVKIDGPPPFDLKKDFVKKDDLPPIDKKEFKDFKDRPFFDKKDKGQPPFFTGLAVVFGADGIFRNFNSINNFDPRKATTRGMGRTSCNGAWADLHHRHDQRVDSYLTLPTTPGLC